MSLQPVEASLPVKHFAMDLPDCVSHWKALPFLFPALPHLTENNEALHPQRLTATLAGKTGYSPSRNDVAAKRPAGSFKTAAIRGLVRMPGMP